jgi:hypothetical protein
MQQRVKIATERVGAERNIRRIAVRKTSGTLTIEIHSAVLRMKNVADLSETVFNRVDPSLPSDDIVRGLKAFPEYFAQFEPDRSPSYPPIIGSPKEGADDALGEASALGAFAVVVSALAGRTFSDEKIGGMVADIGGAILGVELDWRAALRRRDVFLEARGQPLMKRRPSS